MNTEPAFPLFVPTQAGNAVKGMTLRDFFAACAIASGQITLTVPATAATDAYAVADALIAASQS